MDDSPPGLPPRRRFLRWLSGIGAAVSSAAVGLPVLRAVFSPLGAVPSRENWIKVADDVALLDIEALLRMDFVQEMQDAWFSTRAMGTVWLRTEDGENFTCFSGQCTHLGCGVMLAEGGEHLVCPCHRGVFDAKTGEVIDGPPPRGLDRLKAEVRDGSVYVDVRYFRSGLSTSVEV